MYKQFFQISGLCGPQFLRYLPKHFTHLCRALYGVHFLFWCHALWKLGSLDCKTVGFFLKISKEIGQAWRKRPFVWLLARTWIRKNTDCFAVYREFKLLYFRNETCFGAGNLYLLFSHCENHQYVRQHYTYDYLRFFSAQPLNSLLNAICISCSIL